MKVSRWLKDIRRNYKIVEREYEGYEDLFPILIKRGRYKGLTFCFGRIKIEDPTTEQPEPQLNFEYHILEYGSRTEIADKNDFIQNVGKILENMLERKDLPGGLL